MKTALLTGVVLAAVAFNSFATEFVVEGGTGIDASPAARLSLRIPTKWEWLTVETGALMTNGGSIVDVTPMARLISIGKNASIEAGIGLGDNFINNNSGQSQGLIFRDVIRFNYKQYFVEGAHYSNGGKLNPVFGTSDNGGYSYLMGGVRFKF